MCVPRHRRTDHQAPVRDAYRRFGSSLRASFVFLVSRLKLSARARGVHLLGLVCLLICVTAAAHAAPRSPGADVKTATVPGLPCYTVATNVNPSDAGSASATTAQNCPGGYAGGTVVSVSALPSNGFQFSTWSATNCLLANGSQASTTCTITGDGNALVTANFTTNPPTCYALTTTVSTGDGGSATATTPQNCSGGYTSGTAVTISASAN